MAETARRTGYGHGSDVVRRLIARPIRLQAMQPAMPVVAEPAASEEPVEATETGADETVENQAAIPNADRLQTEMLLLKAVLQAERRENKSLRACIGLDAVDEALGDEARAVRARWAALVDRLLHAPA